MMFDPPIDQTTAADDIDFLRGLFTTAADAFDDVEQTTGATWLQAAELNTLRQEYTNAVKANDLR